MHSPHGKRVWQTQTEPPQTVCRGGSFVSAGVQGARSPLPLGHIEDMANALAKYGGAGYDRS